MEKPQEMPTVIDLISQELQGKIKEGVSLCEEMKKITITTQEEYDNTTNFLKDVKKSINFLDNSRKKIGDPYRLKSVEVNGEFSPTIKALQSGEVVLKKAMGVFFSEQERLRLVNERDAQRIADEAERKLQEQAEKEQEKADRYREEGREDLAEKAEVRAENKAFESQNVVADAVSDITKQQGVSFVDEYTVTVTDHEKAVTALLTGSLSYLVTIDEAGLKKALKITRGKMKIDGVACTITKIPRIRV